MFPLLLLACSADPAPAFVVENKCAPAFVVTNRTAPAAHAGPAPAGSEWVRPAGGAWELRRLATPAPEVAAPVQPFRSGDYWPSHACPQCGRQQFAVSGWAGGGQHYHTCALDGTVWRHK